MEDAIKKVLDMLEKGKISPGQAERLIKAIKESEKKERVQEKDFSWLNLGNFISEIVGKSIKESLSSAFTFVSSDLDKNVKTEIPARERIRIISMGGDIEMETEKRANIKIEADAMKYQDKKNETIIELAGDAKIILPEERTLEISIQGGDFKTKGNFKDINFKNMGGDAEFDCEFEKINIKMFGGDSTLKTFEKPLIINTKLFGGEIELPEGFKKVKNIYKYGEGEYQKINLHMFGGDFELKFKED